MAEITLEFDAIGVWVNAPRPGARQALTFAGEPLGTYRALGPDPRDPERLTTTRGAVQTLYRTDKGVLLVHVAQWSHWQGEPNTETVYRLAESDLQPGGAFYELGRACGLAPTLETLKA